MQDEEFSQSDAISGKEETTEESSPLNRTLSNSSCYEQRRNSISSIDKKEVPAKLKVRSASVMNLPQIQIPPTLEKMKDLNFVLREPILCAGYRRYLQITFAEENLDFWKQVEIFKKIRKPEKRHKFAKDLFELYIAERSPKEIDVSPTHREALQQRLDSEEELPVTFFDEIQIEIYHVMKRDSFRQYLSHPTFAQSNDVFKQMRRFSSVSDEELEKGLTDHDWRFLLAGAKEVSFEEGEQILTMNSKPTAMYRVKQGSLRVYKPLPNSDEEHTICFLDNPGCVVGELSVLGNYGFATASVVCHTPCVLHKIEMQFATKLFEREYEMALRFYIFMGKNLAQILKDISALTKKELVVPLAEEKDYEKKEEEEKALGIQRRLEENFHNIFSLMDDEVLISQYKCSLEKVILRKGTIFVSQSGVYFYSKIFQQKTKERLFFRDISSIKLEPQGKFNCCLKIICNRKKYKLIMKAEEGLLLKALMEDLSDAADKNLPKEIMAPNFEVKPQEEEEILSSQDWDILLSGGEGGKENSRSLMTFSEGEAILEEGKNYMMVCQIASGSCRIEKNVPESDMSVVLGTMKEGEVFGEINFLTGYPASASVIAESRVDMYVIGPTVRDVFEKYPNVVIRFYHYLCASLAKRIVQREREGWGRSKID